VNRDEALETLTAGIEAMSTSEDWLRYLDFQRRFHRYSFGNVMLIAMQRPDATNVAGFGKWLELGRAVRKGEKGIAILAPMVGKRKPEAGEAEDADAGPRVVFGYRVAHVFDVSQTDGEPLPAAPRPVQMGGEGPVGVGEALGEVTRSLGYTIRVTSTEPTACASSQPSGSAWLRACPRLPPSRPWCMSWLMRTCTARASSTAPRLS